MQINGPSHIHGPQSLAGPQRAQGTSGPKTPQPMHGVDQVDISTEAELISRIHELPDIRADRVAEVRGQIEAGVYETDEKLDIAVGRLFDELSG